MIFPGETVMHFVMESQNFVMEPAPFCHGIFDFVMETIQNQSRNFLDLSFFSSFFLRKRSRNNNHHDKNDKMNSII